MPYVVLFEQDDMVKALRPGEEWLKDRLDDGMSEEEAIETVIEKDVPAEVLNYRGNRRVLRIVPLEAIPPYFREYRTAWEIAQ